MTVPLVPVPMKRILYTNKQGETKENEEKKNKEK